MDTFAVSYFVEKQKIHEVMEKVLKQCAGDAEGEMKEWRRGRRVEEERREGRDRQRRRRKGRQRRRRRRELRSEGKE